MSEAKCYHIELRDGDKDGDKPVWSEDIEPGGESNDDMALAHLWNKLRELGIDKLAIDMASNDLRSKPEYVDAHRQLKSLEPGKTWEGSVHKPAGDGKYDFTIQCMPASPPATPDPANGG